MEKKSVQPPNYSDAEKAFFTQVQEEIRSAKAQRDTHYPEFDDTTYIKWREENYRARNAYLRARKNEQDTRVVTGTTREKVNTMESFILSLNLEPDIEAYDKNDNFVQQFGTVLEDLVKKSYEVEEGDWDIKEMLLVDEFLTHGDVFAEERYDQIVIPEKELKEMGKEFDKIKWETRLDRVVGQINTQMLNGSNVYLGNIREPILEKQPYIAVRRHVPRSTIQGIYGGWERWKYVPQYLYEMSGTLEQDIDYQGWTLEEFKGNYVEEVRYFNPWTNSFQIFLNGVMMLPVLGSKESPNCFPLSALLGDSSYPLAQGSFEKRTDFAYSPSVPSKTKCDQAVMDEMMRAIVLKTQKSFMPPLANRGKALSKKVFFPGTITDDVNPEHISEIGRNEGVTQSEFNTFQFLKQIVDEKTVSPVMEGQAMPGKQTAREIVELKQQSMMKAGRIIVGWASFRKKLVYLRIANILKNWTEQEDVKLIPVEGAEGAEGAVKSLPQYKTVTIKTSVDGRDGRRIIKFTNQVPTDEQTFAEEDILSELSSGENVRVNYVNPDVIKSLKMTYLVNLEPTQKETGMLRAAKFEELIQKSIAIFAPFGKMPNMDYAGDQMALLNGESPEKFWQQTPNPMQLQQAQMQPQQGGQPQLQPTGGQGINQMAQAERQTLTQ